MKNLMRFGVAGALVAGCVTAQAQNLPSTGNSDLWLFVSNTSAGTTFAEDTGHTLSSLAPTASFAAGTGTSPPTAVLSTAISASFTLGPSTALTAYINAAHAAGQTLDWAVEGIQYPGTPTGTGYRKPGGIVGIASAISSQGDGAFSSASYTLNPAMQNWASGLQGDLTYLKLTYATGGQTYAFSAGSTAGQVWGGPPGSTAAGSTNLYGFGPEQSGVAPGTALQSLYALTGNSGLGQAQSYVLSRNATLSATGTLAVGAVPLPAAVWLFGSGLLGLIGVGRRRAAAA